MAKLTGTDASDNFFLVDASPASSGVQARLGSICALVNAPYGMWQKTGLDSTNWSPLQGTLFNQTATKTVGTSAAETTLLSTGVGSLTLPVDFFQVGKVLRLRAMGFLTTNATPTIDLILKLGSTAILDTGVYTVLAALSASAVFNLEATILCRTVGATGTVFCQGIVETALGAVASNLIPMVKTSATTIDTTASQAIDLTVTWGTSHASNTISLTHFLVEALN